MRRLGVEAEGAAQQEASASCTPRITCKERSKEPAQGGGGAVGTHSVGVQLACHHAQTRCKPSLTTSELTTSELESVTDDVATTSELQSLAAS